MEWHEIAGRKREALLSLIPTSWRISMEDGPSSIPLKHNAILLIDSYLDSSEIYITTKSAESILHDIQSGILTAEETVVAFCHRAALAHQLTNCLSEINFGNAMQEAIQLDQYYRQHHQVKGPLHGLPVSLMDRYNVAGLQSACGFTSWLAGSPKSTADEGVLVQRLKQLGAIVFVKTNIPQGAMMGETCNNIIGTTVNPYNRQLSAGGACGGEGALIALRGSPLGWSWDIAGSTRIPCAFNGLYGLKPSESRLPCSGLEPILPGLPVANGNAGIMAADLSVLSLAFKVMLNTNPWQDDPQIMELPWNENHLQAVRRLHCRPDENDGKLVLGIMRCDKYVQPHSSVKAALDIVEMAMTSCGYEIIDWDPPSHKSGTDILFQILGSTAGKPMRTALDASGEPAAPQIKDWYDAGNVQCSSSEDFWELCRQREKFRADYHHYWANTATRTRSGRRVDGFILPVAPTTAVRCGDFKYFAYSAIANMLDYSAVSFPVILGQPDVAEVPFERLNDFDADVHGAYHSGDHIGLPIGLQVMCQRQQEEKALGLAEAIIEALGRF